MNMQKYMNVSAPFETPTSELLLPQTVVSPRIQSCMYGWILNENKNLTHHPPGASHTSSQHRNIHLEGGRALHRQASQHKTWSERGQRRQPPHFEQVILRIAPNAEDFSCRRGASWRTNVGDNEGQKLEVETFRLWFSRSSSTPFSSKSWPVVWLTYFMLRLIFPEEESTDITLTYTYSSGVWKTMKMKWIRHSNEDAHIVANRNGIRRFEIFVKTGFKHLANMNPTISGWETTCNSRCGKWCWMQSYIPSRSRAAKRTNAPNSFTERTVPEVKVYFNKSEQFLLVYLYECFQSED